MSVEVDEARRHELPGSIEHAQRALGGNPRLECFDDAVADPDVAPASERLTWIQHIASLDHQIELVLRSHDGAGRTRKRGCRGNRASGNEKIASGSPRLPLAGRRLG